MTEKDKFLLFSRELDKSVSELSGWIIHFHPFFTSPFVQMRIDSLKNHFSKLQDIATSPANASKIIVFNVSDHIPLESVVTVFRLLVMGHVIYYQLPSKNDKLIQKFFEALEKLKPGFNNNLHFTSQPVPKADYYILDREISGKTMSDYFSERCLLLKRSASIAVLNGNETDEEIQDLASDITIYFGLGMGNIRKIMVPPGYSFNRLFEALETYHYFKDNHHYFNHFQYQYSLCQLRQEAFLENHFIILKQDEKHTAPPATVYFDYYSTPEELKSGINAHAYYKIYSAQGRYPESSPFGYAKEQCLEPEADILNWINKING